MIALALWLALSIPVALIVGRAYRLGGGDAEAEPQAEGRAEPRGGQDHVPAGAWQ